MRTWRNDGYRGLVEQDWFQQWVAMELDEYCLATGAYADDAIERAVRFARDAQGYDLALHRPAPLRYRLLYRLLRMVGL